MKPTESIARKSSSSRVRDIAELFKLRLAALVVFSSVLGYLMAAKEPDWLQILALCLGGFLLTGGSNGFNQVWEREVDAKMERTKDRPIPTGRMTVAQGIVYSTIAGAIGLGFLFYFLNTLAGVLGGLALLSYVFLYTPMKRASSLAVFIGAFPGAIPPMLGYIAASGEFGVEPGLLFAVQFIWQFPHFWAIAWKANGDYSKAGFKLLPSSQGKGKVSAMYILLYTVSLIPISLTPIVFTEMDWIRMVTVSIAGLAFLWFAIDLYRKRSDEAALKLMFASFVYLPVIQLLYLI